MPRVGSTPERASQHNAESSITNWRDTKTLYTLKQQIAIAVSGTLPTNGYAVSRTIELQSIS